MADSTNGTKSAQPAAGVRPAPAPRPAPKPAPRPTISPQAWEHFLDRINSSHLDPQTKADIIKMVAGLYGIKV